MDIKKRFIIVVSLFLFILINSMYISAICPNQFIIDRPSICDGVPPDDESSNSLYDPAYDEECGESNEGIKVQIYGVYGYSCDEVGLSECCYPNTNTRIPPYEDCSSSEDDDSDGRTNCEDPECWENEQCLPHISGTPPDPGFIYTDGTANADPEIVLSVTVSYILRTDG